MSKYDVNISVSVVAIGKRSSGTHKVDHSRIYQITKEIYIYICKCIYIYIHI